MEGCAGEGRQARVERKLIDPAAHEIIHTPAGEAL
jgi:hypothetical protein